jgi:hypothetical protein
MLLRIEHLSGVDNVRNYPFEIIHELEHLLRTGAPVVPDPRRKGFYDLKSHERIFFIHISPVTGRVLLLATWFRSASGMDHSDRTEAQSGCTA